MTTHDDVQFSQADRLGFGIDSPACLTGRWVIPRIGTSLVSPLKRSGRKEFPEPYTLGVTPYRCEA